MVFYDHRGSNVTKVRPELAGYAGRIAGALLIAGMLAGCASTSMDSAASLGLADQQVDLPASAPAPEGRQGTAAAATAVAAAPPASQPRTAPQAEGPINTGSFPNLNVPPKTAAPQLTAADKARKQAEIRAEQRRQAASGGGGVRNETSALARIGATHADQTLKEIEDAAAAAKATVPDEAQ